MSSPTPAWYPDPHDPARIRWWDGQTWTDNVREHPDATPAPAATAWPGQDQQVQAPQAQAAAAPAATPPQSPVQTLDPPLPPLPGLPEAPVAPDNPPPSAFEPPPSGFEPAPAAPAAYEPAAPSTFAPEPALPVQPAAAAPADVVAPDVEWPVGPAAAPPAPAPELSSAPAAPVARAAPPAPDLSGDAPSIGASRLPPLPAATSPGGRFNEVPPSAFDPDKPKKSAPLRVALLAGVVMVLMLLVAGLYTTGALDKVTGGGSSREASSGTVRVIEGEGYSFELPVDWQASVGQVSNVDLTFAAPNGATLGVSREDEESAADFSNEAVRQVAFDAMVRVQQALIPGLQVTNRTPITLDGAPGERVTLNGSLPSGEAFTLIEIVALHDQRPYVVVLGGSPEQVGDATVAQQFDQIVASYRFD